MTNKTAQTLTLSTVAGDPAETGGPKIDWDRVALTMGPRCHAAWKRDAYGMIRADHGKGSVPAGTLIPGLSTGWATVCEHGTVRPTNTGNGAEVAGKSRATWCAACRDGKARTLPLLGEAVQPTAAPVARTRKPKPTPTTPQETPGTP